MSDKIDYDKIDETIGQAADMLFSASLYIGAQAQLRTPRIKVKILDVAVTASGAYLYQVACDTNREWHEQWVHTERIELPGLHFPPDYETPPPSLEDLMQAQLQDTTTDPLPPAAADKENDHEC